MKKYFLVFLAMLSAFSSLFSLEYDLGGQWVKEGSVEYYDFDPQNPESSDGNLLYFQNDYENRQYVVIDTNKILYRISIDSGKTVSSFKLPDMVEMPGKQSDSLFYNIGNNDSIFIVIQKSTYNYVSTCNIKVYNLLINEPKIIIDTSYTKHFGEFSFHQFDNNTIIATSKEENSYNGTGYSFYFDSYIINLLSHKVSNRNIRIYDNAIQSNKKYIFSETSSASSKSILGDYTSEYDNNKFIVNSNFETLLDFSIIKKTEEMKDGRKFTYYEGPIHLKDFPGFTTDGEFFIAMSNDSIELHKISDSTIIEKYKRNFTSGWNYVGLLSIDKDDFLLVENNFKDTLTKLSKYDLKSCRITDSCFIKYYGEMNIQYLIDDKIVCFNNKYKIDFTKVKNNFFASLQIKNPYILLNQGVSFETLINGHFDKLTWDFGDGNFSEEVNPVHKYKAEGYYSVKLIIDRGGNQYDTLVKENSIYVYNYERIKLNYYNDFTNDQYNTYITLDQSTPDSVFSEFIFYCESIDKNTEYCISKNDTVKLKLASDYYFLNFRFSGQHLDEHLTIDTIACIYPKDNFFESFNIIPSMENEHNCKYFDGTNYLAIGYNNAGNIKRVFGRDCNLIQSTQYNSYISPITKTYKLGGNLLLNYSPQIYNKYNWTISDTNFQYIKDFPFYYNFNTYVDLYDSTKVHFIYNSDSLLYSMNHIINDTLKEIDLISKKQDCDIIFRKLFYINGRVEEYTYYDNVLKRLFINELYSNSSYASGLSIEFEYDKIIPISNGFYIANDGHYFISNDEKVNNYKYSLKYFNLEQAKKINNVAIILLGSDSSKTHQKIVIVNKEIKPVFEKTFDNLLFTIDMVVENSDRSLTLFGKTKLGKNLFIARTIPLDKALDSVLSVESPSPLSSNLLYPNPANNHLSCKLEGAEMGSIEIFNTFGKSEMKLENINSNDYDFNINLSQGFYIVVIKDIYGNTYSEKLIINK